MPTIDPLMPRVLSLPHSSTTSPSTKTRQLKMGRHLTFQRRKEKTATKLPLKDLEKLLRLRLKAMSSLIKGRLTDSEDRDEVTTTDQVTSNLESGEVPGNRKTLQIKRMPILINPRRIQSMELLMPRLLEAKELL